MEDDVTLEERLEEIVNANCEILLDYDPDDDRTKAALKEATELTDRIIELRKIKMEKEDKEERRKMDEAKSKDTIELERSKNQITFRKVLFELAKVVTPILVTAGCYTFHQKRAQEFEETGVARNQSSKDLHIPKYW